MRGAAPYAQKKERGVPEFRHTLFIYANAAFIVSTVSIQTTRLVEGVSKLSFQCCSRDAKFCASTIWLNKPLILNILYVVADIETRHATSLLMAKSHFDTPS